MLRWQSGCSGRQGMELLGCGICSHLVAIIPLPSKQDNLLPALQGIGAAESGP